MVLLLFFLSYAVLWHVYANTINDLIVVGPPERKIASPSARLSLSSSRLDSQP
jgi:hypothetical protein